MSRLARVGMLAIVAGASACSSIYYSAMEAFGVEKRHIMVDRVEEARDEQEGAKEQFKSTLDRFKELAGFDGGDLEAKYRALAAEYEESKERAQEVADRIDSVADVAEDLFEEWEEEIQLIGDPKKQSISEKLMVDTKVRYEKMYDAMRRAEAKMAPVLDAFEDQVLFLKHTLNTTMVASLQDTVVEIETDVSTLIADMEASISEANTFIDEMSGAT